MSNTGYTRKELHEMVVQMQALSDDFYAEAVRIGSHPFIEFTGLMNEYIKMCAQALKEGTDFTNASIHTGLTLPIKTYNALYLAEKFECIFGPTFAANRHASETFIEKAFKDVSVSYKK